MGRDDGALAAKLELALGFAQCGDGFGANLKHGVDHRAEARHRDEAPGQVARGDLADMADAER